MNGQFFFFSWVGIEALTRLKRALNINNGLVQTDELHYENSYVICFTTISSLLAEKMKRCNIFFLISHWNRHPWRQKFPILLFGVPSTLQARTLSPAGRARLGRKFQRRAQFAARYTRRRSSGQASITFIYFFQKLLLSARRDRTGELNGRTSSQEALTTIEGKERHTALSRAPWKSTAKHPTHARTRGKDNASEELENALQRRQQEWRGKRKRKKAQRPCV